jgi:hypothetical protein
MTGLAKITLVGQTNNCKNPQNYDCSLSFSILFRDGKVLTGDRLGWRSELARSLEPDEAAFTIESLAQTTSVVEIFLDNEFQVPELTTLEVDFAFGEIVQTRLTCNGKYLEFESFEMLERMTIASLA